MTMIHEFEQENKCDFPGCKKNFNKKPHAECAVNNEGEVNAFCTQHTRVLRNQGINLKTLIDVQIELGVITESDKNDWLSQAREEFVAKLKRQQHC